MDKTSKIWAVIFLLSMAGMFLFIGGQSYLSYHKMKKWHPVQAVVTSSKLETGNGVHLDILVRLAGESQERPIGLMAGTFLSQSDYRQLAKDYPTGKAVILFQNPEKPDEIVLERAETPNPFLYLWFALGLLSLAGLVKVLKTPVKDVQVY